MVQAREGGRPKYLGLSPQCVIPSPRPLPSSILRIIARYIILPSIGSSVIVRLARIHTVR